MSASTVITGGFGTFGNVSFVITDGYGNYGGPPPPVVVVPQGGAPVPYSTRKRVRKKLPPLPIAEQGAITEAAIALADAAAPITDPRAQEALDDDEILLIALTRILH